MMTSYVYDAALPYRAYLRDGAAATSLDVELTPRAELLLGSATAPADWPVPPVPLTRLFHWGLCEELLDSPHFNAALPELKNSVRTTAAMWAVEQFDTAREAFRRGLPREALTYVERAIEGHEDHDGYALDHRFHLLRGVLRLGSFRQHDETLLDLAIAEEAFATAARYAVCDHPSEAARAAFAAGWCAYCQGRSDDALGHTQQALALNPNFTDAQFQAAKILLHRREPDAAQPYVVFAIGKNPAYAEAALRDGDIAPFTTLVLDVIEQERDILGRRASDALKLLAPLTDNLESIAGHDELAQSILKIVEAARQAFRENTLHGYLRAEAAGAEAVRSAQLLRTRITHEQHSAQELLQTARQQLGEISQLQVGTYRLSAAALRDYEKVSEALHEAETVFRRQTLAGYREARAQAQRVITSLKQIVDSYRDSALKQATAECEAIEREIAQLQERHKPGAGHASAKAFALIGAIVAIFPGGFVSFLSYSRYEEISWPALILRIGLSAAVFSIVGALLGAVLAPLFHTDDSPAVDQQLETRRRSLRQTIAELRTLARRS